jgi:hypothetical protein
MSQDQSTKCTQKIGDKEKQTRKSKKDMFVF